MIRTLLALLLLALSTTAAAQPVVPPAGDVLALPADLRERFHREVLAKSLPPKERLDAIVRFLIEPSGIYLTYRADATYTIAEAYAKRDANCLTFTLMAVALAREAGLEAYGQAIENTLVWEREGDVVYRTNHVNAGVSFQRKRFGIDVSQDSVMLRGLPDPISDARLLALYYNNRAVEIDASGDAATADAYMARSLELDPEYATSWSNAGVLRMRRGDIDGAERHYRRALAIDATHAATLFNMVALQERRGDRAQLAHFRERLDRVQARDPFHHFQKAVALEAARDFTGALRHYRRAIALHDGEHRFFHGLSRVQAALGDVEHSRKSLERAHALSGGDARIRYLGKLQKLQKLRGGRG
ncbi:transglutaminase-like domain-containing protein [Lysobacter humi (ex Lee et al. 2017)]